MLYLTPLTIITYSFPVHTVNSFLTLTKLNFDLYLYIHFLENRVDPDQLASKKPADQDPPCFPICLIKHVNILNSAEFYFFFLWGGGGGV